MGRSNSAIRAKFRSFDDLLCCTISNNLAVELLDGLFSEEQFPFIQGCMIRDLVGQRELGKPFPGVVRCCPLLNISERAILVEMLQKNETEDRFYGDRWSAEGSVNPSGFPIIVVGGDERVKQMRQFF